jgi:hypothetical protein
LDVPNIERRSPAKPVIAQIFFEVPRHCGEKGGVSFSLMKYPTIAEQLDVFAERQEPDPISIVNE